MYAILMKRTLVLVVDRDDDFGVKAGVKTPAIGLGSVSAAASMLGAADPEDSDVNTVYAAIKIYNELRAAGEDADVALICGDTKVGHKSDIKVVDELEEVIRIVSPDRAVLVSDGAEDEYVYPMITSRIKVDSVKKVYVKQAPGLEGAFYVITRILRDDDKRKRILAPISILMMLIAIVFLFPAFMNYNNTGNLAYLYDATATVVLFVIGLIIFLYSYKVWGRLVKYFFNMLNGAKEGDPTVLFLFAAAALFIIGMALGVLAAISPHAISDGQRIMIFISNSMWMFAFAYICNDFGKFIKRYIEEHRVTLGFIVGTMMIFALAFILQASLDTLAVFFGYNIIGQEMIIVEFAVGFGFAVAAIMTKISYERFLRSEREKAELSDALE
jgi:putative membrane protein